MRDNNNGKTIAFAHMMKTGGTSLNQHLKACFGTKMHIIIKPNHLSLDGDPYNLEDLLIDKKNFPKLSVLSGHPLRPFIEFNEYESSLQWITFIRNPIKRYVSHYIHDFNRRDKIRKVKFEEWIEKFGTDNYIVNFIAGKPDLSIAKKILREKFLVVGLTEKLEDSVHMMRIALNNPKFKFLPISKKNPTYNNKVKDKLLVEKEDIIKYRNELDLQLYSFVKNELWPLQVEKYRDQMVNMDKLSKMKENINKILFQVKRQYYYRPNKVNVKNLKQLFRNW